MRARWAIYYRDAVVGGASAEEWRSAPDDGVQYVVLFQPYPDGRRPWCGVSDRQIWTGEDRYDPFGWGVKLGSLIPDAEYHGMWDRVAYADG